ncbi:hypothetical protein BDN72DRAFT_52295 [Pluteus cervinus]|uniref:Uncharacterized protein n=1 Tax=Pluteus cervinus TaxID=181527 RepID=A0ACD3B8T5_9AGAR|nr:hypothetical protein BDN72DRAFT_52295 [Pluteus cervinus]
MLIIACHPNAPVSAQSDHVFTPQPRHTSRSSMVSDASFPRRPDASLATDLTPNASSLDASAPTAPPPLPYPSLALQQLQMQKNFPPRSTSIPLAPGGNGGLPLGQSSTSVNHYAAAHRSLGVASGLGASSSTTLHATSAVAVATNKAGAFFSSLGRKASLSRRDRIADVTAGQRLGVAMANGGHRVLTKSPPPMNQHQHQQMQVINNANARAAVAAAAGAGGEKGKDAGSLNSSSSSGSLKFAPAGNGNSSANLNGGSGSTPPGAASLPPNTAPLNAQINAHAFPVTPLKNVAATPGSSKSPPSKPTSPSSNPVTPTRPLHIASNPSLPPSPLPVPNGPRAPPPANRVSRSHTVLAPSSTFKNTFFLSEKGKEKEVERERGLGNNNGFMSEREVESKPKDAHKRRPSLFALPSKNHGRQDQLSDYHNYSDVPKSALSKSKSFNPHGSHYSNRDNHNPGGISNGIAAPGVMGPGNASGSDTFEAHVDRLANVIKGIDRQILAGYVERAGSDTLAIGQYLEDNKKGAIKPPNH